jgi:adenylylsulfate reductase subunit B
VLIVYLRFFGQKTLGGKSMPSYVIDEKCDGCKGQDRTACMYICPNDLMVLDAEAMKGYNQEPEFCWECYNCVKICPQQAVDVRGYADFVPMGASVVPLRGSEDIMWTVKFRNGTIKRFKFPIRTTAEGSAVPAGGFAEGPGDLKDQNLWTEPASLGVAALPTKK